MAEQPLGAMKNGWPADRFSACGFCANAFRLVVPTLADAIGMLFREAVATVPEVATASGSTLWQRLGKLAARVVTSPPAQSRIATARENFSKEG